MVYLSISWQPSGLRSGGIKKNITNIFKFLLMFWKKQSPLFIFLFLFIEFEVGQKLKKRKTLFYALPNPILLAVIQSLVVTNMERRLRDFAHKY